MNLTHFSYFSLSEAHTVLNKNFLLFISDVVTIIFLSTDVWNLNPSFLWCLQISSGQCLPPGLYLSNPWLIAYLLFLYILFQKKINRYVFRVMYFIDFSPKKWVFFKKEKGAPHRIMVLYWLCVKKNGRLLNFQFSSALSKKKLPGIHNGLIIHSHCKISNPEIARRKD